MSASQPPSNVDPSTSLINADPSIRSSSVAKTSRGSLIHIDPTLFSSAAVRCGAQLVGLVVSEYSKAAIQRALTVNIPSDWIVGWFQREWLKFDFRSLLLDKSLISHPFRVATPDQITYFASVSKLGIDDAFLAVIHETCPSVVLAVLCHFGIIDTCFIDLLKGTPIAPFVDREVRKRTKSLNVRLSSSELTLRKLDMAFHGLCSRDTNLSFSQFKIRHGTATWGAYVGIVIYRHWLKTKVVHDQVLTVCYAEECLRPESTLSLTSFPTGAISTSAADTSHRTPTFSSVGSSTPSTVTVRRTIPFSSEVSSEGGSSTSGNAESIMSTRIPSASLAALEVIKSGATTKLVSAAVTDLKELFAETYASRNPMFKRIFSSGGLSYKKVKEFLDYKSNPNNPMNEAKCKQLMVQFMKVTREAAELMRTGYMVGIDAALTTDAVLESTEITYGKRVGVVLCYLCYVGELKLVDEVNSLECNLSAIMQCLVYLSTADNDTLMKGVVAHSCLDLKGLSVVIVEHHVKDISAFLSALIMVLKRTWAFKAAQLTELDTLNYGSSGRALRGIDLSHTHDLTTEEYKNIAALNAIVNGKMSDIGSMKFLFSLRAAVSRFGGVTSSHIDVLADIQMLERTGVFGAVVKGVRITAPQIGQIAHEHKKVVDAKLLKVFGGVDNFEPTINIHFADFLKGNFYLSLDDTTSVSKKTMTFSFLSASGSVVTSQDMETKIDRYFQSLPENCLLDIEGHFYQALNALQVVVGLVSVNRQTEFTTVFLRDQPGGMFRTFRGFDVVRCPVSKEPLLIMYRISDKWRGTSTPEACLSLLHPLFNRQLLVAGCFRRAFANLVQRRSKEKKIREYLLDNYFLDDKGNVIEDGSSFNSTSFNNHVRSMIEKLNADKATAIPLPARLAVDEDESDIVADDDGFEAGFEADVGSRQVAIPEVTPIAFFIQSLLRHFNETFYKFLTTLLAKEAKYSIVAMDIIDRVVFGHSSATGFLYDSNATYTNDSAGMKTADFEIVYTTMKKAWEYLDLNKYMNQNILRQDSRHATFRALVKVGPLDTMKKLREAATKYVMAETETLRRSLSLPPHVAVSWRSKELAEVVALSLVNDHCTERIADFGVYLQTGGGKTALPFFSALLNQHSLTPACALIHFVVVSRSDLAGDLVSRAGAAGIAVARWEAATMDDSMQKLRAKSGCSLYVGVVDTVISPTSMTHIKELVDLKVLRRMILDEAHCFVVDTFDFREKLNQFAACFGDAMSPLKQLSLTYISATMTVEIEAELLRKFNRFDSGLEARVKPSPHQNKEVLYLYKRIPSHKEVTDLVANECVRASQEGKKVCVAFMTIKECNDLTDALRIKSLACALNTSEFKRDYPTVHAANLSSWLSADPFSLSVCVSTMPFAGCDPKKLDLLMLVGGYDVVGWKQTAGRGRNGCTCAFIICDDNIRLLKRLNTSDDTRPLLCRPQGLLDMIKALNSRDCVRRELMKTTYSDEDDVEKICSLTCKDLRARVGEGSDTRLCGNCAEAGSIVWPFPLQRDDVEDLLQPPHHPPPPPPSPPQAPAVPQAPAAAMAPVVPQASVPLAPAQDTPHVVVPSPPVAGLAPDVSQASVPPAAASVTPPVIVLPSPPAASGNHSAIPARIANPYSQNRSTAPAPKTSADPIIVGIPLGGGTKRPGVTGLSTETREDFLLKNQKQQKEVVESNVNEAVNASYKATLKAIKERRNTLSSKPCFFCDNTHCMLTKTSGGYCPKFSSLTEGWKTNQLRCFCCFSLGHGSNNCKNCKSDAYNGRICQNCLSPGCSRDTSAGSDSVFQSYKLACASTRDKDFDLANRAKCVIFYVCHDQTTYSAFKTFMTQKFGIAQSVPPFSKDGRNFFKWALDKKFDTGPQRHILNFVFLLDFWLSDFCNNLRESNGS